jgi:transposase InsO family protein
MSERHALRYAPAADRNATLRQAIETLAYRHRRYGAAMIGLKLRQQGWRVNHKRIDRLYALAKLQLRRRKRKKVPVSERQPLLRPEASAQVWSMDFVFDRVAGGRVVKCLAVVDDATALLGHADAATTKTYLRGRKINTVEALKRRKM